VAEENYGRRGGGEECVVPSGGAEGGSQGGEDGDLDIELVVVPRDPGRWQGSVSGRTSVRLKFGWLRKIPGRRTDSETIIKENGISSLNCILYEVVVVGFVRRVPIAVSC